MGVRPLLLCAAAALATLCGCSSPTHLEDLEAPTMFWVQGRALCSRIAAVDRGGVVWGEQGCENGRPELDRVRTASPTELDALRASFARLPFDERGALASECHGRLLHTFSLVEGPAASERSVAACGGSIMYDDVAALPAPFRAVAEAFTRAQGR